MGLFEASALIVAANVLAFLVYGYDKHQARAHGDRIPERTLLMLAVLGGVGAWIGCEVFRHKTRKQPFRSWLVVALVAHLGIVFAVLAWLPG